MNKALRQYLGLAISVCVYYLFHEGAHLLYALSIGTFREIRFLGLGIQIDVYADRMTDLQMGILCLVGALTTLAVSWLLLTLTEKSVKPEARCLNLPCTM